MQPNRSAPPLVEMCPRKREGAAAEGGRGLHSKRDEMDGRGQSGGGGLANSEQLPLPLQLPKGIAPLPSSPPPLMSAFSTPSARLSNARSLPSPSSLQPERPRPRCRRADSHSGWVRPSTARRGGVVAAAKAGVTARGSGCGLLRRGCSEGMDRNT